MKTVGVMSQVADVLAGASEMFEALLSINVGMFQHTYVSDDCVCQLCVCGRLKSCIDQQQEEELKQQLKVRGRRRQQGVRRRSGGGALV